MMMFDDMGLCSDLDYFTGPLGEKDLPVSMNEPEPTVEDDYSDEEIDVDELERRMWRDKMRLKRLKEQTKGGKEGIDNAKQRQSQEQARRKKMSRAQDGILKYVTRRCSGRTLSSSYLSLFAVLSYGVASISMVFINKEIQ